MSFASSEARKKMRPIQALDPALERTREILFRPFDFATWVHLAVIIFMTRLVGCAGTSTSNSYDSSQDFGGETEDVRETVNTFTTWVGDNIGLVAGIAIAFVVVSVLFITLFSWLGSRGHLMFVRAVATGDSHLGGIGKRLRQPILRCSCSGSR